MKPGPKKPGFFLSSLTCWKKRRPHSSIGLEHYTFNIGVSSSSLDGVTKCIFNSIGRVLPLHGRGYRFESYRMYK